MSKADQQFVTMCRDILDDGTTTEGQKGPSGVLRHPCLYH